MNQCLGLGCAVAGNYNDISNVALIAACLIKSFYKHAVLGSYIGEAYAVEKIANKVNDLGLVTRNVVFNKLINKHSRLNNRSCKTDGS